MARVTLRLGDAERPVEIDLRPGVAVLVGRRPDARLLDARRRASLPAALEVLPIEAPQVSANHLLLVCDEDEHVTVEDLHSLNLSRLILAPFSLVRLDGKRPVVIELAPRGVRGLAGEPAEVDEPDDRFPLAVAAAVTGWLDANDLPARAVVHDISEAPEASPVPPFPLGGRWLVALEPTRAVGTFDIKWEPVREIVWTYLHRQDSRYRCGRDEGHAPDLCFNSAAIRAAHARLFDAAKLGQRLVLLGETGTGKSSLALCYHRHSRRRGPFEHVNCAELTPNFAHARLFGSRRGAYTGAVTDLRGAVERAQGGVLFLDEVGLLSAEVQGALLTFLDTGRFTPLGDDVPRTADVAIVCATSDDLRLAIRERRFRDDLWYRLAAGPVLRVPPLRERPEEVEAVLRSRRLTPGAARVIDELLDGAARDFLTRVYDWPGNLRELNSFIDRLRSAPAARIDRALCRDLLLEGRIDASTFPGAVERGGRGDWSELLERARVAFRRMNDGREPDTARELTAYVERALKPLFFARRLGLDAPGPRPERTLRQMATELGCTDDTVRNQLKLFDELKPYLGGPDAAG